MKYNRSGIARWRALFLSFAVLLFGCETVDEPWSGPSGGGTGGSDGRLSADIRIVATRKSEATVDVLLAPGRNMPAERYSLGVCYLCDVDPSRRLPEYGDGSGLEDPSRKNRYTVFCSRAETQVVIRAYVRTESGCMSYGDYVQVFPKVDGGIWAVPAKPQWAVAEDGRTVELSSSVVGETDGSVKRRGFCLAKPGTAPEQAASRISVGETFGARIDTLRRGIEYAVWAYLEDDWELRYGDSTHVRIPAPELLPEVETADGATVSIRRVTASGRVVETHGAREVRAGIEWRIAEEDFGRNMTHWRTVTPSAAGGFSMARTVDRPGRWLYRAFVTTEYGWGYGAVRSVEVPPYEQYLPTVRTDSRVVSHTAATAVVAGEVLSDGGVGITERGICHGPTSRPDLSGKEVEVRGTVGRMTARIEGIPLDKTYYYRAYAENAAGRVYGEVQTLYIRSSDFRVEFRDLEARVASDGSVTFRVRIANDRGQKFRERGFCWDYASYGTPTVSDHKKDARSVLGSSYEVRVSSTYDVRKGMKYRVRAYVVTEDGVTWYSSDRTYDAVYFTVPKDDD